MNQTKHGVYLLRYLLILFLALYPFTVTKQVRAISVANNSISQPDNIGFAPTEDLITGLGPTQIISGDLDGDNRPDLLTANHGWYGNIGNTISVFRNLSINGTVSFAPKVDFTVNEGPYGMTLADLDGDGKVDVINTNYAANGLGTTISVMLNTSVPGNISFAPKVDFLAGNGPLEVAASDLDKDGKPDLAITNHAEGRESTVTVLHNTSTSGHISFSPLISFPVEIGPYGIAISDIDGDSYPDIVVTNPGPTPFAGTTISILKNTSKFGNISFAPKMDYTVGEGPRGIAINDLDGDNKPDVIVTNFGNEDGMTISILRNTSTPGSISLAQRVDYTVGIAPHGVAVSDLNNDNKPDIVVTNFGNYDGTTISILQNSSSIGEISFLEKVDYAVRNAPHSVTINDLDGDAMRDLAVANYGRGAGNIISIFINMIGVPKTLTIHKAGSGSGTVMSIPTGIDCGDTCDAKFDFGSQVTLLAEPANGSSFFGWDDACSGFQKCIINLDDSKSVTATFIIGTVFKSYMPLVKSR